MFNFFTAIVLAGLLGQSGFDFLSGVAADFAYPTAVTKPAAVARIANNSLGLKTTAKGIMVAAENSPAILYQKNPHAVYPIASLTKLMTALVVLDSRPDWQKTVILAPVDQRAGGKVYLFPGDAVTMENLFNLMLISSTNEAAAALARASGISDFTQAMNHKAAQLGMINTTFTDPTGLEAQNVSSASDLLILARAAFARPEIMAAVKNSQYAFSVANSGRRISAASTDQLLGSFLNHGDYQIIGAKTGYLDEVSYCLLLQVQKINGPVLTLVLLGTETLADRWQEAKGLVDWTMNNYRF